MQTVLLKSALRINYYREILANKPITNHDYTRAISVWVLIQVNDLLSKSLSHKKHLLKRSLFSQEIRYGSYCLL